jgi:hypothetical protein
VEAGCCASAKAPRRGLARSISRVAPVASSTSAPRCSAPPRMCSGYFTTRLAGCGPAASDAQAAAQRRRIRIRARTERRTAQPRCSVETPIAWRARVLRALRKGREQGAAERAQRGAKRTPRPELQAPGGAPGQRAAHADGGAVRGGEGAAHHKGKHHRAHRRLQPKQRSVVNPVATAHAARVSAQRLGAASCALPAAQHARVRAAGRCAARLNLTEAFIGSGSRGRCAATAGRASGRAARRSSKPARGAAVTRSEEERGWVCARAMAARRSCGAHAASLLSVQRWHRSTHRRQLHERPGMRAAPALQQICALSHRPAPAPAAHALLPAPHAAPPAPLPPARRAQLPRRCAPRRLLPPRQSQQSQSASALPTRRLLPRPPLPRSARRTLARCPPRGDAA